MHGFLICLESMHNQIPICVFEKISFRVSELMKPINTHTILLFK